MDILKVTQAQDLSGHFRHISGTVSESVSMFVIGRADGGALAVEKVDIDGYKLKPRKQKRQNTRITDNLRSKPLLTLLLYT